ncbi:hypothetical protein NKG99_20520 [Mesorhizobium sp. M1409]|uniref:hypothetical protein n=1 Tax=Mesorhizobium sp. M1409 TaxID=2957100 RepID=UPI00333D5763
MSEKIFSAAELAKEAEREVRQRRWTYARLVGEGRLQAEIAERRIALMEEIALELRRRAEAEEPTLL